MLKNPYNSVVVFFLVSTLLTCTLTLHAMNSTVNNSNNDTRINKYKKYLESNIEAQKKFSAAITKEKIIFSATSKRILNDFLEQYYVKQCLQTLSLSDGIDLSVQIASLEDTLEEKLCFFTKLNVNDKLTWRQVEFVIDRHKDYLKNLQKLLIDYAKETFADVDWSQLEI